MPSPITNLPANSTRPGATGRSRSAADARIVTALALLIIALVIGEATSLDFTLQDRLHDAASGQWMVDARAPIPRLLFYDGPKAAIIALGVALIVLIAGPGRWRTRLAVTRVRLASTILVMAIVPAFVGYLKARSDVFCPAQLIRYGGKEVHRRPFQFRSQEDTHTRRGRCWPAGHASGGFALVGLALLGRTRRGARIGLAIGLAAGWIMGGYQILKGAHFLSHTLVTMMIACVFTAVVARALAPPDSRSAPESAR